ncbi:hypothetical protein TNIN_52221 [Trichonephila inaurata madagascariensis]|uniref:Uncharacterized protein n=1 Tax=Trichonephila inaurata madagascariensis TaxID=2747483 RepID=A0A8X6WPZ2_9ARAC|nr:hypothetical protein TNIN_52221 [Trichonephila inaurata madagascariensis]
MWSHNIFLKPGCEDVFNLDSMTNKTIASREGIEMQDMRVMQDIAKMTTNTTRKPKHNNDDGDIDNNGSSDNDIDYGDTSVFCNTLTE